MSGSIRQPGEQEAEEEAIEKVLQETLGSPQRPYPSLVASVFEYIDKPVLAQIVRQEKKQKQRRQDWELLKALALHSLQASYMASVRYVKIHYARASRAQAEKSRHRVISAIPVIGLPIVFGFILIVVIIALAYTLTHPLPGFTGPTGSGNRIVAPLGTIPVQRQADVTPTPPVVTVSGSPTVTVVGGPKPTIMLCMTPQDKAQSRIRVCGINFTPGDKVSLYISPAGGGRPKIRHAVTVDAQGKFIDLWVVNGCRDVPFAIYAQDVSPSHGTEVSQVLHNIQFGSCPASLPGRN
jgi:hypothetical protein